MNRRLLLFFTILLISESLIKSAYNDCNAFSCSKLNVESGQKCELYNSKCTLLYNSCTGIGSDKCNENILLYNEPSFKCDYQEGECQKTERPCSEYPIVSSLGVTCKSLQVSNPETKICVLTGNNCEEKDKSAYGCSASDATDCGNQTPIDENNKVEPLKKCIKKNVCTSELKQCTDFKTGDICEKLSTSDLNTKRCFSSSDECLEKLIKCEAYSVDDSKTDDLNKEACEAIIPYNIIESDNSIEEDKHSKCTYDKTQKVCKKVKKECELNL